MKCFDALNKCIFLFLHLPRKACTGFLAKIKPIKNFLHEHTGSKWPKAFLNLTFKFSCRWTNSDLGSAIILLPPSALGPTPYDPSSDRCTVFDQVNSGRQQISFFQNLKMGPNFSSDNLTPSSVGLGPKTTFHRVITNTDLPLITKVHIPNG